MSYTNFVVSGLPAYVKELEPVLVKNFGLIGGGTRSRIGIQTGIKKNANLNFLELTPVLQDGSVCEVEPSGAVTLTDREIETAWIEVFFSICPKTLLGTYAEHMVRANANAESKPFEAEITDGLVKELNAKIEKLIWQGDKSQSGADVKWIDGFAKIIETDGTQVTVSGATVLAKLQQLYAGMSDHALAQGGEIYVSPANYRAFLMDLVNANLYHYPSAEGEFPKEFFLPGTDAKVVMTEGLAGVNKAYASFAKNLRYGCDMEHDEESIKVIYDEVKELVYVRALWNSGVQVAFPADSFYAAL